MVPAMLASDVRKQNFSLQMCSFSPFQSFKNAECRYMVAVGKTVDCIVISQIWCDPKLYKLLPHPTITTKTVTQGALSWSSLSMPLVI